MDMAEAAVDVLRRLGGGRPMHYRRSAHAEAASRLGALWGAWEQAQIDLGSAPSQWWVWHLRRPVGRAHQPRRPFCSLHRRPSRTGRAPLALGAQVRDRQ
ncbi:MAG TPA: DUF4913 domain-containing protein [Acidimicrobiales bacterium]|nr:DUF4913 domain-containing protein [Acidimicrobiales bacterium]